MARSSYDDLHDRLDAIDTKKAGTRYERLVALVQKSLDETAGVSHDLRLVGDDTQVKHQIDVTITRNNEHRRVLIECKDFDISGDLVGLGIIRDFYGVVDDVKPDEALVITCNGFTDDARRYAKGKGIKLAILRRHTDEDDEGTIKKLRCRSGLDPITAVDRIQFGCRGPLRDVDPDRSGSLIGCSPFVWILVMDRLGGLDRSGARRDARCGVSGGDRETTG